MPTIQAQELTEFITALYCAAGTPDDIAQTVAESLVLTNLVGHDSHGVIQTLRYIRKVQSGDVKPTGRPELESKRGSTAIINCNWGFGQPGAQMGVAVACELAAEFGVGCVSLSKVNHIARLGEYAQAIAERGYIAMIITTGSGYFGAVAPYGSRERRFGTNPMCWGIPLGEGKLPLVSDFATSAYANGKIDIAISKGEPLPDGILIDKDGYPTTDPHTFREGGAMLPFGSYKGYGLMLVIEIVASILSGFAPAATELFHPGNPTLMFAMDIEYFTTKERFHSLTNELLENVKNSAPAPGFDEVLLPGEPEQRAYAKRTVEGIPIPETTWTEFLNLADELGVAHP